MTTRNVLFLDCDGVLLDWIRPFFQFCGIPVEEADTQQTYSLVSSGHFPDLPTFLDKMQEFEQSNAWGSLPPLGTMLSLTDLKNSGLELQVVTALDVDASTAARRVRNLSYHYGPVFSGIHVVGGTMDKNVFIKQWCGRQNPRDNVNVIGLVEDKGTTLLKTAELHRYAWDRGAEAPVSYGIKQPYNREFWGHPGIVWSAGIDALSFRLVGAIQQKQLDEVRFG